MNGFTFHKLLAQPGDVNAEDMYHFENDNPGYFVTVAVPSTSSLYPLRTFKHSLLQDYERESGKKATVLVLLLHDEHYYPVKNLRSLLNEYDNYARRYFCRSCFSGFNTQEILKKHYNSCGMGSTQVYEYLMPEEDKASMSFRGKWLNEAQRHPFAFYADSECYHELADAGEERFVSPESPQPSTLTASPPPPKKAKHGGGTAVLDKHQPYMMAYYLAIIPEFRAVLDN